MLRYFNLPKVIQAVRSGTRTPTQGFWLQNFLLTLPPWFKAVIIASLVQGRQEPSDYYFERGQVDSLIKLCRGLLLGLPEWIQYGEALRGEYSEEEEKENYEAMNRAGNANDVFWGPWNGEEVFSRK